MECDWKCVGEDEKNENVATLTRPNRSIGDGRDDLGDEIDAAANVVTTSQ